MLLVDDGSARVRRAIDKLVASSRLLRVERLAENAARVWQYSRASRSAARGSRTRQSTPIAAT